MPESALVEGRAIVHLKDIVDGEVRKWHGPWGAGRDADVEETLAFFAVLREEAELASLPPMTGRR